MLTIFKGYARDASDLPHHCAQIGDMWSAGQSLWVLTANKRELKHVGARGATIVLATGECTLELVNHAVDFGMFEFWAVCCEFKYHDVHRRTLAMCVELSSDNCMTINCPRVPKV